jgi:hypothetical protein
MMWARATEVYYILIYFSGASEGCNTAVLRIYQEEVCGGGDWHWRALTLTLVAQIRSTSKDVLERASLYFLKRAASRGPRLGLPYDGCHIAGAILTFCKQKGLVFFVHSIITFT